MNQDCAYGWRHGQDKPSPYIKGIWHPIVGGTLLLAGARGHASVDIDSLLHTLHTLQAVAWLLTDFPEIVELDLNPVFTEPDGAFVADGRAVLAEREESIIRGTNYGK